MRIQAGEIRRAMDGGKGVMPRRPGLMDARLKVLDALTRVLTFGRGRICVFHPGGLRLETTGTTGKNNFERGARTAKRIHRPKGAAEGNR